MICSKRHVNMVCRSPRFTDTTAKAGFGREMPLADAQGRCNGQTAGFTNPWLAQTVIWNLFPLLRVCRYRSAVRAPRRRDVPNEHMGILGAIERRDPDEAERRMRAYIAVGREQLLVESQTSTQRLDRVTDARAVFADKALVVPPERRLGSDDVDGVVEIKESAL
jgi:hypothetical protein